LWLNNQVAGFLGLAHQDGLFSAPEIKLSQALADQTSAQLENVLLQQIRLAKTRTQTEMDLARSVQLRLLPQHLPQIDSLDIFGASYPALQVGGDFYDAILTNPGHLSFAVGDVSGKGMPSALLMAMTRIVTRNLARLMDNLRPAELLARTNAELYSDFTEVNMFVTLFVGRYESHSHLLEYANAGHSPVILCQQHHSAVLLEADGPPVGVLPTSLATNQHLVLHPDDILVVATDGFAEAINMAGERFGYERLCHLIEVYRSASAQTIAERLLLAVSEFSQGVAQEDDQTLIVIKGLPNE
jgi:sigma-B regulation protein RsbU (phosphoserine phosphatase)